MPLGRAGIRHGLHALILGRESAASASVCRAHAPITRQCGVAARLVPAGGGLVHAQAPATERQGAACGVGRTMAGCTVGAMEEGGSRRAVPRPPLPATARDLTAWSNRDPAGAAVSSDARGPTLSSRGQALLLLLYLYAGMPFSPSLVAPGMTILSFSILSLSNGTETSLLPMPRKQRCGRSAVALTARTCEGPERWMGAIDCVLVIRRRSTPT